MPIKKPTTKRVKAISKEVVKSVPDNTEVVKPNSTVPASEGTRRIGLSKGVTLNMGDYQSARIDCWMERIVPDNDRDVIKTLAEMSELIDATLEEEKGNL